MRTLRWTAGLAGALLGLAAVATAAPATAATAPDPAARLIPFGSCEELIAYAREHVPKPPPGVPTPEPMPVPPVAAAPEDGAAERIADDPDFSSTNVQEAGVDEPDIVKTDGRRIFAVAGDRLHEIDARAAVPRVTASIDLGGSGQHDLLLWRDRGFVVSQVYGGMPGLARPATTIAPFPEQTVLTELDLSEPGRMRVVRTLRVEGSYRAARLVDGVVRLVTSSTPEALSDPRAREAIGGWIPTYRVVKRRARRAAARPVADCTDVRRPPEYAGLGLLTILTIDLAKGIAPVDSEAILSDVGTVYASPEALYVSTYPQTPGATEPDTSTSSDDAASAATLIHKFSATGRADTRYRATGAVPGGLLSQWSLSEHAGVLRAASTRAATWSGEGRASRSESLVTTLEERDGQLVQLGQVGGLGRDERIYAVRFIGDVGYVVTFREVDPLYTIDLADPRRPAVLGELKIPGYSAYLHPVGEDLLLGVGQDATEQGRRLGGQVSLFDVSDLRRPRRLASMRLPGWSSEVEWDHHAFLYWPRTRLAVVPADGYGPDGNRAGATGLRITRADGLRHVGELRHPRGDDGVRRSLVVGSRLFTLSADGMLSSDLATLAGERWLPFGG